jgi:hypothetical protein
MLTLFGIANTLACQVENEKASPDQMEAAWNSVSDQLLGQNLWNAKAESALKTLFTAVRKFRGSMCMRARVRACVCGRYGNGH